MSPTEWRRTSCWVCASSAWIIWGLSGDCLGIVAGIRREIGLAKYLDALAGLRTGPRDWPL
jgi:hypothetical protein